MLTADARPDPQAPYARAEITVRGLGGPPGTASFQLRRSTVDYVEPNLDITGWTRSEAALRPLESWWSAEDGSFHFLISGLLCQHIDPGPLKLRLPGAGGGEVDLFWPEDIAVYDDGTLVAPERAETVAVEPAPVDTAQLDTARVERERAAAETARRAEAAAQEARERAARLAAEAKAEAERIVAAEAKAKADAEAAAEAKAAEERRAQEAQAEAARREQAAAAEREAQAKAAAARSVWTTVQPVQPPAPARSRRWSWGRRLRMVVVVFILLRVAGLLWREYGPDRETHSASAFPTPLPYQRSTPGFSLGAGAVDGPAAPTMEAALDRVVRGVSTQGGWEVEPSLARRPAREIIDRVSDPERLVRYGQRKLVQSPPDPVGADVLFEEATRPHFGRYRDEPYAPAWIARALLYDPSVEHALSQPRPNAGFADDLYWHATASGDRRVGEMAEANRRRLKQWRSQHPEE